MMNKWNIFDEYGRNAQLKPGIIAFLPLTMSLIAWSGIGSPILKTMGALLATSGGTYVLAMIARNRGRSIQNLLWIKWGGAPTIQLLRHRGIGNPILRERWHRSLEQLLGRKFPTAKKEMSDPKNADAIYEAATKLLIHERRDKAKYSLIFRENINYGFCRNLYALRSIGIANSTIGTVTSIAFLINTNTEMQALPGICASLSAIMLIVWLFIIKHHWVKPPAMAYAERLLESCDASSENSKMKQAQTPDCASST